MSTSPSEHGPDRRSVLLVGLGAGAALLSGCTLNNPYSSDKTPAAKAVRDLSPDVAVAVKAVVLIRTQVNLLGDTVTAFPSLASRLSGLRTLHQAHLDALIAAVPKRVDTSTAGAQVQPPGEAAQALLNAGSGELGLREELDRLALQAESGSFARLLGTMSAGIAQQTLKARVLGGHHQLAALRLPVVARAKVGLDALQDALAAEHAALAVYAFLGAQASQSRQPALYATLSTAYSDHRRSRDQLTVMISALGAVPTPAAVAYDLPARVRTTSEMTDAALLVERRIASTFGLLIESTAGAERRWALVALDQAAVRQLELRGTPEMFPGSAIRS
ncbi:DUF4439 domain-containing protein [Nocardioides marmorisolisilvae]|nr:DUF4439 domain-containing protein [Nocardioides marmorisolisilvae]